MSHCPPIHDPTGHMVPNVPIAVITTDSEPFGGEARGQKNGPPRGATVDSISLNCWQIQRLVDKRGRAIEIEIAVDVLLHYRR